MDQLKLKDKEDGITIIDTGYYQDLGGNSGPAGCKEKVKMNYMMEGGKAYHVMLLMWASTYKVPSRTPILGVLDGTQCWGMGCM